MAQNIDVSIIPQSYLPEIKVSENDNSLRVIRVSIIDENGEAYQIPSGVTATFAGTKPSGLGFTVPCTIDGSAVQFTMENTVCNEQGRFPAEIRLINGEARIGTCNVLLNVEPNPHPDDTTDGDREPLVNEITALLQQITEQADRVEADADRAQQAAEDAAQSEAKAEQAKQEWENMSATAETLPAGSEASASYSNGVLSLGIPKGDKGDQGEQGDPGAIGATPDLQIGTVETLDPGEDATATITGTPEEPILSLGIPQGEKGDPGDVSMEQLLALAVYDEASGEIASFPDGSDGLPMKSLKVSLEPVQDLHGYDKPWPPGGGKNLVDVADGSVTDSRANLGEVIVPSGTYTASAFLRREDGGSCRVFLKVGDEFKNGSGVNGVSGGVSSCTFTVSEPTTVLTGVQFLASYSTMYYSQYQLELGSTATAYEPYENICPITGWDEVNTVACGKNLLASGDLTSGGYIDNNNGTVRTYSTWSYSGFIPVSPGRYRFMRLNNGVYERITGTNAYFAFYNEDKSFNIGNTGDNINFTSTSIKYVRVSAPTSYMNKIVLVADADASDFVNESDYVDGQFITTTLPQTVYGGTLDVVTGELVVDRAYVGGSSWTQYNANNGYKAYRLSAVLAISYDAQVAGVMSNVMSEVIYEQKYNSTANKYDRYGIYGTSGKHGRF